MRAVFLLLLLGVGNCYRDIVSILLSARRVFDSPTISTTSSEATTAPLKKLGRSWWQNTDIESSVALEKQNQKDNRKKASDFVKRTDFSSLFDKTTSAAEAGRTWWKRRREEVHATEERQNGEPSSIDVKRTEFDSYFDDDQSSERDQRKFKPQLIGEFSKIHQHKWKNLQ